MTVCDTVIVGAGLAGLVAARRLVEGGQSVVVPEARERNGGRIFGMEREGRLLGPRDPGDLARSRGGSECGPDS